MAAEDGKAGKLAPEWVANIGEVAMHIVLHKNKYSKSTDIVVSCESLVFILTEKGEIRYQRRFDFMPSCIKTYHLQKSGADVYDDEGQRTLETNIAQRNMNTPCFMMLLGSFTNFLMVYNDVRLVWAAKTQLPPMFVDVASFGGSRGLIVTMSDTGFL